MKYINEVKINLPVDQLIKLFDSAENMYEWMDGLERHEMVSGVPGEPGSKMKMYFKSGKTEFEMLETIIEKNLPKIFSAKYETKYATNIVRNSFEALSSDITMMTSETEVNPHSFIVRLMSWLLPASFKKQSQVYLDNFKRFAESISS